MRKVFAVAVVAAGIFSTGLARADDVITPDSVAGQNIQAAADFIRQTGDAALADNIVDFLKNGRFYKGSYPDKAGLTSAFNNITLDGQTVAPLTRPIPPNATGDAFGLLLKLAATLAHEKKHAHQSVLTKTNGSLKEFEAWTTEIVDLDQWIKYLRGEAKKSASAENLERLKVAVKHKIDTLNEFVKEEKCFGYPCDTWIELRDLLVETQERLDKQKPKQPEDPKIQTLIESADKKEQDAKDHAPKASDPAPPLPPGVAPPAPRTPTHRVAACEPCRAKADTLNAAADKLADATEVDSVTHKAMEEDLDRLAKDLDACEASECAKPAAPKEVGLAPKSGPSDTGVALGVRAGAAIPLGSAAQDDSLSDGIALGIPITIEGGYRFARAFVVGAYVGWGPLLEKNCPSGASCSGWDLRFGVAGEYHLQSTPTVDPWFGVAAGWEILHGSTSSAAASTSSSLSGFELLTLQGGADFALANAIAAGPFVSLSFGEYLNASTSGVPGVPDSSSSITNKALHEWLTFGVRGTYGIALP